MDRSLFHVKRLVGSVAFLMIVNCIPAFAQGKHTITNSGKPHPTLFIQAVWDAAMHDAEAAKLSAIEKEAIYYINLARSHPTEFADSMVRPYLITYPEFKRSYGESLVGTLKAMKAVSMMPADQRLNGIAILHTRDIARQNSISHIGSNGKSPGDRLQEAGFTCGAECVHMSSFGNAAEMILSLLIDYGIKDLGHRKALLNPANNKIGVGVVEKSGLFYLVVNMACD